MNCGPSDEVTREWLEVYDECKTAPDGLKSIFFRLALDMLPEGVDPDNERVKDALKEIQKANS